MQPASGTETFREETQSLLIAGCGYLGQRVAAAWRQQGRNVFAVTRSSATAAKLEEQGITPIVCDLSVSAPREALPQVDSVLWSVGFDRSAGVSRDDIWIRGMQRLVGSFSEQAPRRLIFVSSTSVYGDADGDVVSEATPPAPTTEGGAACLRAEQHVQSLLSGSRTDVVILRLAGIYGPGRLLRRQAELRSQVPLAGLPDDWLNLIHVQDAAVMVDWVLKSEQSPALINVVNNGTLTRREYYGLLAELVGAPEPVFAGNDLSGHRRRSGNKRVISVVRPELSVRFQFDDVRDGLRQAVSEEVMDDL